MGGWRLFDNLERPLTIKNFDVDQQKSNSVSYRYIEHNTPPIKYECEVTTIGNGNSVERKFYDYDDRIVRWGSPPLE